MACEHRPVPASAGLSARLSACLVCAMRNERSGIERNQGKRAIEGLQVWILLRFYSCPPCPEALQYR